jgi:hypothetical protein
MAIMFGISTRRQARLERSDFGSPVIEELEGRQLLSAVQVFAPHTHGVGQASAAEWSWILGFSAPNDPLSDTTGALASLNNSGPVFFLAGSNGGTPAHRSFNVPAGVPILVPLANAELSTLEGAGNTPTQVSAAVKQLADLVDSLHATIDGVPIPSSELFTHREVAPTFHFVSAPNNPIGDPVGNSGIAEADGYWLMLAPLKAGDVHTINFGGGFSAFGLSFDTTDTITVVPNCNDAQAQHDQESALRQQQLSMSARYSGASATTDSSHRRLVEQVLGS